MKYLFSSILTLLILCSTSHAQSTSTDSTTKAAISELNFLIGNWNGSGWYMKKERIEFDQQTHVEFKLDSTMIIMETIASVKNRIMINEVIVITYNKNAEKYAIQTFIPSGKNQNVSAKLSDGVLSWSPKPTMRQSITLTKKGELIQNMDVIKKEEAIQVSEVKLEQIKPLK